MQAEGFEKYFNKGSGKIESNVGLSEVVVNDGNKAVDKVRCSVLFKEAAVRTANLVN